MRAHFDPLLSTTARLLVSALALAALLLGSVLPSSTSASVDHDTESEQSSAPDVRRVTGADRIETAANAALEGFGNPSDTAVLARADDFPDALAAAGFAGTVSAPMLLTAADEVSEPVWSALEDLQVDSVILAGGEHALSPAVADELRQDYEVKRINGDGRYETAAALARAGFDEHDEEVTAFLASGEDFPDALAAGSVAYHDRRPVLLTPSHELHPAAKAALEELRVDRAIVLGGSNALSDAVEDELAQLDIATDRLGGATRVDTARLIAEHGIDDADLSPDHPVLVRGDDFADALVAGTYAGNLATPILVAAGPNVLGGALGEWVASACEQIVALHALGGTAALSDRVVEALQSAAGTCDPPQEQPDPSQGRGSDRDSATSGEPYTFDGRTSGTVTIPDGYPNPSTTGLRGAGVSESDLSTYSGPTSFSSGTHVIEGQRIRDQITVSGSAHVIVRESLVETGARYGLHTSFSNPGRITLEDSTVRMTSADSRALVGHNFTVRRSDIRHGTTVSNLQNNIVVEDSFFADPGYPSQSGGHHDGMQTVGGTDFTVTGSTILGRWRAQTSAMILSADVRDIRNLRVEDNFLSGGNFTMYLGPKSGRSVNGAVVADNVWNAGSWQYGPQSLDCSGIRSLTWTGNRDTDGNTISGC